MPPFLPRGSVGINYRTAEHHARDVGRLRRVTQSDLLVEDRDLGGSGAFPAVFGGPSEGEKAVLAQAALPIAQQRQVGVAPWWDVTRAPPSLRQVPVAKGPH